MIHAADYIATFWFLGMLIVLLMILFNENKKDPEKRPLFLPNEQIDRPFTERRFTFDEYKDASIEELLKDFKPFDLYILGMITEEELDELEKGRI